MNVQERHLPKKKWKLRTLGLAFGSSTVAYLLYHQDAEVKNLEVSHGSACHHAFFLQFCHAYRLPNLKANESDEVKCKVADKLIKQFVSTLNFEYFWEKYI